jgi:hypothetical protein
METVLADGDWRARERHWIHTIRLFYPGGANLSDGGEGTPGAVHTPEARAKMSAVRKGKKHSLEHCAKIGAANRGKKHSSESRAKSSAAKKGNKFSVGRVLSAETRAKIGAKQIGNKHTPERRAKMTATRHENIRNRQQAIPDKEAA